MARNPIIREPFPKDPATDETPHGCALCMSSGFVFFGVEEDGEEEIERVPCRRCHAIAQEVLYEEQRRSATVIDGVYVLKRLRQ